MLIATCKRSNCLDVRQWSSWLIDDVIVGSESHACRRPCSAGDAGSGRGWNAGGGIEERHVGDCVGLQSPLNDRGRCCVVMLVASYGSASSSVVIRRRRCLLVAPAKSRDAAIVSCAVMSTSQASCCYTLQLSNCWQSDAVPTTTRNRVIRQLQLILTNCWNRSAPECTMAHQRKRHQYNELKRKQSSTKYPCCGSHTPGVVSPTTASTDDDDIRPMHTPTVNIAIIHCLNEWGCRTPGVQSIVTHNNKVSKDSVA